MILISLVIEYGLSVWGLSPVEVEMHTYYKIPGRSKGAGSLIRAANIDDISANAVVVFRLGFQRDAPIREDRITWTGAECHQRGIGCLGFSSV